MDNLTDLSRTMLFTLASRGLADRLVPELGFQDAEAKALLRHLPDGLVSSCSELPVVKPIAMRAKLMDELAMVFFQNHSNSVGVNLGSGLCTRELRIRNHPDLVGQFEWFNIDLPEVIEIRRKFLPHVNPNNLISHSITEVQWLEHVLPTIDRSLLIVMEGVVPYLTSSQNKILFSHLAAHLGSAIPRVEMVFDYMHPELTGRRYTQNKVDGTRLPFKSGFKNIDEVLNLHSNFNLISEYNYFSQISSFHAFFEKQFRLEHNGNSPYAVAHLSLNSTKDSEE